jgi:HPt (histidine-containing phosphotransfer) domain-containing protein
MSTPQEQFQAFLALQRAEYQRALPGKVAQLQAAWVALATGSASSAPGELERQAHTLAGTAGTLGLREVGAAARALEELLIQTGEVGAALTPVQRSKISAAVDALHASLPPD